MNKIAARVRRAHKTRAKIRVQAVKQGISRLTVHRTAKHIYAQVIKQENNQCTVLASASTLEKELRKDLSGTAVDMAKVVGSKIAERAKKAGIEKVAFDRSGFMYHGRVKALADAAREGGLEF